MRLSALSSLALAALVVFQSVAPLYAQAEGEADPLWNRPSYEKKITQIGQRIQAANGITERILYVYSREHIINATANRYMGNQITVYEDLLTLVDNDDELAAVLSHEIAHITLRHQRRATVARLGVGLVMGTAMVAAAAAAPYTLGASAVGLSRLSAKAGSAPVNRGLEKEADLAGLDYLVKAGYNPLAMETIMNKIAADGNVSTRIFSNHPLGSDRLQYIHTAIVNRFPQFLTPATRNVLVPGSPYQVQTATTIPNRTVYASPNGLIATTGTIPQQPIAGTMPPSSPSVNPTNGGVLMLASTPSNLPAQPQGQSPASTITPAATAPASTVIEKTSAIIKPEPASSPLVPAPAPVSYQPAKKALKQQPRMVSYSHPSSHTSQNKAAFANSSPAKTMTAKEPHLTEAINQPQPAPISVAQTLLELQPDALRLVKLVSQRGTMSHQDIVVEFESLDEGTLEAMLMDLRTNKKLLSIQGAESNSAYTLTERAARVLRPQ